MEKTNSIHQNPPSEADILLAGQETRRIVYNPKVQL